MLVAAFASTRVAKIIADMTQDNAGSVNGTYILGFTLSLEHYPRQFLATS